MPGCEFALKGQKKAKARAHAGPCKLVIIGSVPIN
jgi:hypothetical protein